MTTSSIVGRTMGFESQHLRSNPHISVVRPTSSAFGGNSGLSPLKIRVTAPGLPNSENGTFPVKTSLANIANAKTSAGLDSMFVSVVP